MDDASPNELDLEDELLSGVSSEALLNDDDVDLSLSTNVQEKENNFFKECKEDLSQSITACKNDAETMSNSCLGISNKTSNNHNELKELEWQRTKKGKSVKFKNSNASSQGKKKIRNKKDAQFSKKEWHMTKKRKSTNFKNLNALSQRKKKINNKKNDAQVYNKAINSWISNNIPSLLSLDTNQFNINQNFKNHGLTENSLPSLLDDIPDLWPSVAAARNIDMQKLNNLAGFKNYEHFPAQYCDQNILNDELSSSNRINSFFKNSFSQNIANNNLHSEISNFLFSEAGTRIMDNYCVSQNFYKEHSNSKPGLNISTNDCHNYRNKQTNNKGLYVTPNWQNKEDFNKAKFKNSDKTENEFRRKQPVKKNGQNKMKKKKKKKNGLLNKILQMNNETINKNINFGEKKIGITNYSKDLDSINVYKKKTITMQTDRSDTHWIDKKYVQEMEDQGIRKIKDSQIKALPVRDKIILLDDKNEVLKQNFEVPYSSKEDITFKNFGTLKSEPEVEIINEIKPCVNSNSSKSMVSTATDSEKNWSHLNENIVKIRNLPSGMTVKDLSLLCLPVGKPIETKLYFPKENAAAIRFRERSTAENFYKLFHNREINNHTLEVIIV